MSTKAERFGKRVQDRREQLGRSQIEVWQRGGPSNTTLTAIENGRTSLTKATARKLDAGLDWEEGSAWGTWHDGTEPVPLAARSKLGLRPAPQMVSPQDPYYVSLLANRLAELEDRVDVLEQRLTEGGDQGGQRDAPANQTAEPGLPQQPGVVVTTAKGQTITPADQESGKPQTPADRDSDSSR